MKKVIISEKPSVAKNIADALKIKGKQEGYYEGEGYIITWAFGHLLQLYDAKDYDARMAKWKMDNFPFIPEQFKYKVKSDPRNREKEDLGAKKQLKIIYSLMKRKDVDSIVSACDYDREGQLIGDSIIYNSRTDKNVYRLLLNEWTPVEVIRGLESLRPNSELKPLLDAGMSRQWADWAIGINLTSAATLKYQKGSGKALNIGRVLLPTLKIIYDRDKEIENFVPEKYFKLTARFKTVNGEEYEGTYVVDEEEKFKDRDILESAVKNIAGHNARIIEKKIEKKRELPPLLFNLSNLQGYITGKYKGWTSDKVLKVAQSLYEKKYITYPRTASYVLEESLAGKAAKVLETLKQNLSYKEEVIFTKSKRVFDSSRVESHSAIIPTYLLPKTLSADEAAVYNAIKNRFIMQFMPAAEYEETRITTAIPEAGLAGVFLSKGRVELVEGWKKVEKIEAKETLLPNVNSGEEVSVSGTDLSDHVTKPPKHHTEKTLLRVMETCGKGQEEEDSEEMMAAILAGYSIGTPATRAETIKKLKDIGYIEAQNKNLLCTSLGRNLVETFPVRELFDLEFTGRLEKTLSDIEKKKVAKEDFLSMIFGFTSSSVEKIKEDEPVILQEAVRERKTAEILGKCPECGIGSIIEGQKGFGCSNWKSGCKFVIWKNDKYLAALKKKPSAAMVKSLMKKGSANVKGLTSKKGTKFNAILRYEKDQEKGYYSWKMEFENKPSMKKAKKD